MSAYRIAFGLPKAAIGAQAETLGETRVWVLPNPSGLNANYQIPELVAAFAEFKAAAFG